MQTDVNRIDLVKSFSISPVPISFSMRIHHSNQCLASKIGFDTAENEPRKVWITDLTQKFVKVYLYHFLPAQEVGGESHNWVADK